MWRSDCYRSESLREGRDLEMMRPVRTIAGVAICSGRHGSPSLLNYRIGIATKNFSELD